MLPTTKDRPRFLRMLWELELYVGFLVITFQYPKVWRLIEDLWKAGARKGDLNGKEGD